MIIPGSYQDVTRLKGKEGAPAFVPATSLTTFIAPGPNVAALSKEWDECMKIPLLMKIMPRQVFSGLYC